MKVLPFLIDRDNKRHAASALMIKTSRRREGFQHQAPSPRPGKRACNAAAAQDTRAQALPALRVELAPDPDARRAMNVLGGRGDQADSAPARGRGRRTMRRAGQAME